MPVKMFALQSSDHQARVLRQLGQRTISLRSGALGPVDDRMEMSQVMGSRIHLFLVCLVVSQSSGASAPNQELPLFNDVHVHLTNYVQQGLTAQQLLNIMGKTVGRATLFGIPLQQQWSCRISGNVAPTYYLQTDAPLYYYSLTDAAIAQAYLSLSPDDRARFDPMITGFNPTDMYAVDHIRRVLQLFPGVFSGIGEFTIHKEFVSSKIAGDVASLMDPALDRILDFAAEVGLVVLLHNDIDMPFAQDGAPPVHYQQLVQLFRRHPKTLLIWAHLGVGRVVHPVKNHLELVKRIFEDPELSHVHVDLSWSELAKYIVASEETVRRTAQIINDHPDRFLFGTDEVAPTTPEKYLAVYRQYGPLWKRLTVAAKSKVLRENFSRLFGEARQKVRAWERANLPPSLSFPKTTASSPPSTLESP